MMLGASYSRLTKCTARLHKCIWKWLAEQLTRLCTAIIYNRPSSGTRERRHIPRRSTGSCCSLATRTSRINLRLSDQCRQAAEQDVHVEQQRPPPDVDAVICNATRVGAAATLDLPHADKARPGAGVIMGGETVARE